MSVTARLNNLRIAPRKVRLVAHSIKGLPVQVALIRLRQEVQRSALPMRVLLESAIANATNNFKLAKENLYVAEVRVLDGVRLKRFTPKAFGSATPILKRMSKVEIILNEKIPAIKKPVVVAKSVRTKPSAAPKAMAKPVAKTVALKSNVTPDTVATT